MIDLTGAVRAVEALMTDTFQILRDPASSDPDTLSQATGQLTPQAGGDNTIIYDGPGKIVASRRLGHDLERAGEQFITAYFTFSAPLTAPALQAGDWAVCTTSARDPAGVGQRYRVTTPLYGTVTISRKAQVIAEDRQAGAA